MISKNGVAIAVLALGALGVDVSDNTVLEFFGAIAQIVSFGMLIYNQWKRRDTVGFFFKE